jgi:hypothetical protein
LLGVSGYQGLVEVSLQLHKGGFILLLSTTEPADLAFSLTKLHEHEPLS